MRIMSIYFSRISLHFEVFVTFRTTKPEFFSVVADEHDLKSNFEKVYFYAMSRLAKSAYNDQEGYYIYWSTAEITSMYSVRKLVDLL